MKEDRYILLVEDNDLDAERISRALKNETRAPEIKRAIDAEQALDALRDNQALGHHARHPLVLLDLNLPRISGLEFLSQVRSETAIAHTPVIVLTTSNLQSDIDQAYENQVMGYVIKPLELSAMKDVVLAIDRFWDICQPPLRQCQ